MLYYNTKIPVWGRFLNNFAWCFSWRVVSVAMGLYCGVVLFAANPGEVTGGFGDIRYMQDLSSPICKNAQENDSIQLIDRRDGQSYWVTKLRDNNCWMTQNLALDLYGRTLTPADSDVSNNWNGAASVSSNTWSNTSSNYIGWYISPTNQDAGHLSYGNYYSWQAATAGSAPSNTGEAEDSICPAGWNLPTKDQFVALASGLNWTTIRTSPYYFVAGGGVWSGNLSNAGNVGYYWSSTAINSTNAYSLSFSSSSVNPSNNPTRYYGLYVRCLMQGS